MFVFSNLLALAWLVASPIPQNPARGYVVSSTVCYATLGTPLSLGTGGNTTDATSWATGSYTPTGNAAVFAVVVNSRASSVTTPTFSGNSLTWVQVDTVTYDTIATPLHRITLFRAQGASPSAGAGTADFGGVTQTGCLIRVFEVANADASAANAANAILQHVTNQADTTANPSITYSTPSTNGSAMIFVYGDTVNSSTDSTAPANWTEMGEQAYNTAATGLTVNYQSPSLAATSAAATATSRNWGCIGVEVMPRVVTCPTGIFANALIDLHTTTATTQLTAAIWNSGTVKSGLWTGTSGAGEWTGTASSAIVAAATANSLHSAFTISGVDYGPSNTSLRAKIDNNAAFTQHFVDIASIAVRNLTVAGFVTFGQTDTGASAALYDVVQIQGSVTGQSVILQLDTKQVSGANHYDVNIETNPGGVTTHSSHINVAKDTTYWFSLRWSNGGTASLKLFETSTWTEIGSVTSSQTTGEDIGPVNFGHGEGGTQSTFMYLENIVFDYTNFVQPLGP
jgi:hypothetical protein